MLYTFKQKSGATGVVAWGKINGDPRYGNSKNGKHYCNFFLRYDSEPKKSPTEKTAGKTIQVATWEGTADFASQLEKGDTIIVFGQLRKSEYKGEETYQISGDIVLYPSAQQIALNSAMTLKSMGNGHPKTDNSAIVESDTETGDLFSDVDEEDINNIFPSL